MCNDGLELLYEFSSTFRKIFYKNEFDSRFRASFIPVADFKDRGGVKQVNVGGARVRVHLRDD